MLLFYNNTIHSDMIHKHNETISIYAASHVKIILLFLEHNTFL